VKKRLGKIRNFSYTWIRYGISVRPIYKGAEAFCNPHLSQGGPIKKNITPLESKWGESRL